MVAIVTQYYFAYATVGKILSLPAFLLYLSLQVEIF